MTKYRHLFGLQGSTYVYSESDKPPTKDEMYEIWRWKGDKELHEDDGVSFMIVTHSKEVASFADRSLELRDGRFVAEHGVGVDVEDLSRGRELIIDETGTVTLPPDVLLRIGGPGKYVTSNIDNGLLSLQGEKVESMGKLELSPICPACKHDYGDSDDQECPSCGSSRPMVEV